MFYFQGYILKDGTSVKKEDLEEILLKDNSELKIHHKLTKLHFDCTRGSRQRVRLAAQLLSHSTATALRYLFPKKSKIADWVELVDQWFDASNSSCMYSVKKLGSGFGIHKAEQLHVFSKMEEMISGMRVVGRKSLLPFQKGILISIQSTRLLFAEVSQKGLKCILTRHLSSDPTENSFACLRSMGGTCGHPGPVDLSNRVRLLIMSRNAEVVVENSAVEIQAPDRETAEEDENISAAILSQIFDNDSATEK